MQTMRAASGAPARRHRQSRTRDAILAAAGEALAADPTASLTDVTAAAGVSRATFYRHFESRAALLAALDLEPDPGAKARILAAALDQLAEGGLRGLSMDDVAEAAGVSRASVYRLFPGKQALFAGLLEVYSPFADVGAAIHRVVGLPPGEALPRLLRDAAAAMSSRSAVMRSLLLEASSGTPDAVAAAQLAISPLYAELAPYFATQMEAGHLRPVHPMVAAQAFLGPLMLFLLTQSVAAPVAGFGDDAPDAAEAFAQIALRGLLP